MVRLLHSVLLFFLVSVSYNQYIDDFENPNSASINQNNPNLHLYNGNGGGVNIRQASNMNTNQYNRNDGQIPPPINPPPPHPYPPVNPPPPHYPNGSNPNNEDFSVTVQVQLRSYFNSHSMLDASRTCACTVGECLRVSPQNLGFRCFFSFMIIISSADSSVQYRATDFLLLDSIGHIDSNYTQKFSEIQTFNLNNQPTAIDIFVHNLGAVVDAYSNKLEISNTVYHVDTFVHPLNSTIASRGPNQMQQARLIGNLLGTELGISYSVMCKGPLIGPGCDLQCNSSTINSNTAVCNNRRTGFYSVCQWVSGRSQVTDCTNCPWGIRENAYCMDESGGVLEGHHAGVVSEGFRTATIILAIFCGIFVLLIVLIIVVCCMRTPKKTRSSPRGHQNYETEYLTHQNGDDIRPLNTTANANTTFSTTVSSGNPQPAPRSYQPPALTARPNKSVLRSPHLYQMPPASHLIGGASLNSSFSSTVPPVPPSVSADV